MIIIILLFHNMDLALMINIILQLFTVCLQFIYIFLINYLYITILHTF